MSDKGSIAEAINTIRKRNKLVKKSIAGIGRVFPIGEEPKALVSSFVRLDKPAVVKRKLVLPKTMEERPPQTLDELKEQVKEELKEEAKEEPKEQEVKAEPKAEPVEEKKQSKYRIKRNVMHIAI